MHVLIEKEPDIQQIVRNSRVHKLQNDSPIWTATYERLSWEQLQPLMMMKVECSGKDGVTKRVLFFVCSNNWIRCWFTALLSTKTVSFIHYVINQLHSRPPRILTGNRSRSRSIHRSPIVIISDEDLLLFSSLLHPTLSSVANAINMRTLQIINYTYRIQLHDKIKDVIVPPFLSLSLTFSGSSRVGEHSQWTANTIRIDEFRGGRNDKGNNIWTKYPFEEENKNESISMTI